MPTPAPGWGPSHFHCCSPCLKPACPHQVQVLFAEAEPTACFLPVPKQAGSSIYNVLKLAQMKLVVIRLLGPSGTLMAQGTEVCSVSCVLTDPHFLEHPLFVRAVWVCFSR